MIGSVLPSARWTPFSQTNGLGQSMTLYRWTNRAASEDDKIVTNPDGFQFKDPSGNVLGTLDMMKRYKALMFVVNKRFSHRWHGQISYVLSKSYGNVDNSSEASFGANSSTNGGGGAFAYETPNVSLVNAQGERPTAAGTRSRSSSASGCRRSRLGVNAYFRALSGRPYTPYQRFATSVISFPASSGGRRVLLEPRGSRRRDQGEHPRPPPGEIFKARGGQEQDLDLRRHHERLQPVGGHGPAVPGPEPGHRRRDRGLCIARPSSSRARPRSASAGRSRLTPLP
jgi:hypothetical protein